MKLQKGLTVEINPVENLSVDDVADGLIAGNDGNWPVDSATLLLVRHRYWLGEEVFRRFLVLDDDHGAIYVDWARLRDQLDELAELDAPLPEISVLRIATSIAMFYRVDLRSALFAHDPATIEHIALAVFHAAGYSDAVVKARPGVDGP